MKSNIVQISAGDKRCESLFDALMEVCCERAGDMPLPSVLGVLTLLEHEIIRSAMEPD